MHDYADHFELATDAVATPERWARAMFGNVPNLGELFIWGVMLQLRLSRKRSSSTVAGWRIVDRDDERIRLEATSWFMTANLVVRAVDSRVSLDTLIHYDRWAAHVIWPPLSAVHRALVPGVLRKAAARIQPTARPERGEDQYPSAVAATSRNRAAVAVGMNKLGRSRGDRPKMSP